MKRLFLIAPLLASSVIMGCASVSLTGPEQATQAKSNGAQTSAAGATSADRIAVNDGAGNVIVEKVEFRPGVSSSTVERLARRFGCAGSTGAGLITEKGPVEVYRMQCDNGTTFIAQCELRQCRPMR
jgi:hypothetical protein